MENQDKIDDLFYTFESLADKEEYYVSILEGNSSSDEKHRAKVFLAKTREMILKTTSELEILGYEPLKVWAWYNGNDVEW